MTRYLLILALLLAPLSPVVPVAAAVAESAPPGRCCCCPADVCQCGCETPVGPADSENKDNPQGARFCDCDVAPLGMPSSTKSSPDRSGVSGVTEVRAQHVPTANIRSCFSDHWPQGPPPALQHLATIILLN